MGQPIPTDVTDLPLGLAATPLDALARLEAALPTTELAPPTAFTRLEVELPPSPRFASPLAWLQREARAAEEKVYFRCREQHQLEAAGLGFALRLTGARDGDDAEVRRVVCAMVAASARLRFYGGMRFDPEGQEADEWRQFGRYTFVLPLVERLRLAGRDFVAVNVAPSCKHSIAKARRILERLRRAEVKRAAHHSPHATQTRLLDQYPKYAASMKRIMLDLQSDAYKKIVLVRRRAFDFDTIPSAIDIAAGLDAAIGGGYLFCLELDRGTAFLGCSPERLFRLSDVHFATEAMAGTIRRTPHADAKDDECKLLNSAKDLVEHKYVVDYITDVLRSSGASVETTRPQVVRLPHLMHLQTEISGEFKKNGFHCPVDRAFHLLASLHPTPAVCGMPRSITMQRIPDLEQFDRGLYAGPFGFFSRDATEFCVAIRSAVVTGRSVVAYAGGGIVAASETQSEWDEGELKMSTMRAILDPRRGPRKDVLDRRLRTSPRSVDALLT